jgi:hypothetical protein
LVDSAFVFFLGGRKNADFIASESLTGVTATLVNDLITPKGVSTLVLITEHPMQPRIGSWVIVHQREQLRPRWFVLLRDTLSL